MRGIAAKLRKARTDAGLSQRELARRIPTSQSRICDMESGARPPTMAMLSRVAPILGVTVVDLLIDGPELFELEFGLDIAGPTPWAERRFLAAVPDVARSSVSVWPSMGDGCLRVRARSSALPAVLGMVGGAVRGVAPELPPPEVRPVTAAASLFVLVKAAERAEASEKIRTKVAHLCAAPRLSVRQRADLWSVRVSGLSRRVSVSLQGLAPTSPVGLFVPA